MSDQVRAYGVVRWFLVTAALIAALAGMADCVPHVHPDASAVVAAGDCGHGDRYGECLAPAVAAVAAQAASPACAAPGPGVGMPPRVLGAAQSNVISRSSAGDRRLLMCSWLL